MSHHVWIRHGHNGGQYPGRKSATYHCWQDMKARCYNPNIGAYRLYGARGIQVCPAWRKDFRQFLKDMGERAPGMQIERIDNDGNYEPSNCRWATRSDQMRNRRTNRRVTYQGKTQSIAEWAAQMDVPWHLIGTRLDRGWSVEEALMSPSDKHRRHCTRIVKEYVVYTPEYGTVVPILDDGTGPTEWGADALYVRTTSRDRAKTLAFHAWRRRSHGWIHQRLRDRENPFSGMKVEPLKDGWRAVRDA